MSGRPGKIVRWLKEFVAEPAFRRRVDFLAQVPLFSGIPRRGLATVLGSLSARSYHKGEALCEAGAVGQFLFVIESGAVEVVEPGPAARQRRAATLGPGSFFGELAVLTDRPRAASVVAIEPVGAFLLYKTELERLLREEPAIGAVIMQRLAQVLATRLVAERSA